MANTKYYNSILRAVITSFSDSQSSKENFVHSRNTLQWVEFFYKQEKETTEIDDAMKIAALSHNLECVLEKRVKHSDYSDHQSYLVAVAQKSALIARNLMKKCEAEESFTKEVCYLIEHIYDNNPSEERTYILGNADALSFLDVVLAFDCKSKAEKEISELCAWEYSRLSDRAIKELDRFYFYDDSMNKYIHNLVKKESPSLVEA